MTVHSMCRILRFLAALRRRDDGIAGIEFGLLAPILLTIVVGIVDFGMAAYVKREAQAAAQAGVQFALIEGWEPTAIEAVVAASSTLDAPAIWVEKVFACAGATGLVFVSEGAGCAGGPAGTYVRVTVQADFTPMLPLEGLSVGAVAAVVRID